MEPTDVFSWRIRWLAIFVGLSAAALFFFLSTLAALVPALLPLGAALQPRLSDPGKRLVKWFIWAWAFGWSPGLVLLAFRMRSGFPLDRDFVTLSVSSLLIASALLILWWDVELIVDGVRRLRIWRSEPPKEPRPVGRGTWIFAFLLNLWAGWGLLRGLTMYHRDLYALTMMLVEAIIVAAFDISLIRRVFKLRRAQRAG
jgi:hypothetical protein